MRDAHTAGPGLAPPRVVRSALAGVVQARRGYALEVPSEAHRRLAAAWLLLGVAALVGAGLLAVLLVVARTPGLREAMPSADFFRVVLVAHVDLSVLVWFLAFAGVLWTINSGSHALAAGWLALALVASATAAIAISPFAGTAAPVMSNYIPVLDGPVFLAGLIILGAGVALLVVRGMRQAPPVGTTLDGSAALRFGLNASLVSAAVALIAFGWSWAAIPRSLPAAGYYDILFWGGGHVLQFTWSLLLVVAWLWLADAAGLTLPLSPRVVTLLFGVGLASVFAIPLIYLAFDVGSVEHHRLLTWLMRFGGALAIPPIGIAVAWSLVRQRAGSPAARAPRAALAASLVLFAAGGAIGFLIRGSDVRIPAHYHGAIVGVTIAMMGLAYHLLPRLGLAMPSVRLATLQPWVYGGGQLVHITGLVWSGGYGVQRKVAGSEQVLHGAREVAGMALMGAGGLVAVIGGLLFVVVVLQALASRRCSR